MAVERNALIAIVVSLTGGCAALNSVSDSLFTDRSEKSREVQDIFYRQKAAIEGRAAAGYLTWVHAARNVRDVDRSLAGYPDTATAHATSRDSGTYMGETYLLVATFAAMGQSSPLTLTQERP